MTRGKRTVYRISLLVVAIALLAGLTVAITCSEPNENPASSPASPPSPTLPPTPLLKPLPQQPTREPEEVVLPPGGPVLPHTLWGHVMTDSGKPAAGVVITVLVNGSPQEVTATTNDSGQYGGNLLVEFPSTLPVTGKNGDTIDFLVDGIPAEKTRLGTLVETGESYEWQWQDLPSGWELIFVSGEHNGLDLVYTPAK